jgi:hypothetical protein
MTEAFEHRCRSHGDFSCKDSSSNCDEADGRARADVAAVVACEINREENIVHVRSWPSIKVYDNRIERAYRVPIIVGSGGVREVGWKSLMGRIAVRRHMIMIERRRRHAGERC